MKHLLIVVLLGFSAPRIFAQETDSTKRSGEFWVGAQAIIPIGLFAQQVDLSFGAGLNFGFTFSPIKEKDFFQVGMNCGIGYIGKDVDSIRKTNSNLYTFHLMTRLTLPSTHRILPYVDVLGGGNMFYLNTHRNNNLFDALLKSEDYTSLQSQSSGTWSYGLGVGFKLMSTKSNATGMLDVRCIYLTSGRMNYYFPTYRRTRVTNTSMLFPQIGYVYRFNSKK